MNTKKRYFKALTALGAGAIILSCAVFANYDNANSYTKCKNAVKSVLYADNKSMDYTAEIKLDGENLLAYYGSYKINTKGNPSYRYENTYELDGNVDFSLQQSQDDKDIRKGISGNREYGYYYKTSDKTQTLVQELNGGENGFGDKMINFLETIADVFVGDLKNNFVLTESSGESAKYSINLTREQMPEYINSGVSLAASAVTSSVKQEFDGKIADADLSSEEKALMSFFGSKEPYVKGISASGVIDKNNIPEDIDLVIEFAGYDENGAEHIISLNANLSFYDFGSTAIEKITEDELSAMEYRGDFGNSESITINSMADLGEDIDIVVTDDNTGSFKE